MRLVLSVKDHELYSQKLLKTFIGNLSIWQQEKHELSNLNLP